MLLTYTDSVPSVQYAGLDLQYLSNLHYELIMDRIRLCLKVAFSTMRKVFRRLWLFSFNKMCFFAAY